MLKDEIVELIVQGQGSRITPEETATQILELIELREVEAKADDWRPLIPCAPVFKLLGVVAIMSGLMLGGKVIPTKYALPLMVGGFLLNANVPRRV